MIASYTPRFIDKLTEHMKQAQGLICEWTHSFIIGGVDYYETSDTKFPTTKAINSLDLTEVKSK